MKTYRSRTTGNWKCKTWWKLCSRVQILWRSEESWLSYYITSGFKNANSHWRIQYIELCRSSRWCRENDFCGTRKFIDLEERDHKITDWIIQEFRLVCGNASRPMARGTNPRYTVLTVGRQILRGRCMRYRRCDHCMSPEDPELILAHQEHYKWRCQGWVWYWWDWGWVFETIWGFEKHSRWKHRGSIRMDVARKWCQLWCLIYSGLTE